MTEPTSEATSSGSSSSVFKILLATDCHLGYEERNSKKSITAIYLFVIIYNN